jgi:hypothetical protein
VHLGGGVVHRDSAGLLLLLLFRIVGGEVGRDALPGVAPVARAEEELRADVDGALLRRAGVDGGVPVEAQLLAVAGLGLDVARRSSAPIDPADVAALELGVDGLRIGGIDEGPETVAVVEVLPA